MPKFILSGDILHPGSVAVEADTLAEAYEKAGEGEFEVYDEQDDCLAFIPGGPAFDEHGTEIEEDESVEVEDLSLLFESDDYRRGREDAARAVEALPYAEGKATLMYRGAAVAAARGDQ